MTRTRSVAIIALSGALMSCVGQVDAPPASHPVSVRLLSSQTTSLPFSGHYVSVVDSLDLAVTLPDGTKLRRGMKLGRKDSTATFPLSLPDGAFTFDVRILSSKDTVLFQQTKPVTISSDNFQVDLIPAPQSPVLLVTPDSNFAALIDTALPPTGLAVRMASVFIYNRGSGALSWAVKDSLSANATGKCTCVFYRPSGGTIQAGTSITLSLVRPSSAGNTGSVITFTVTSAAGDVTVVIPPF